MKHLLKIWKMKLFFMRCSSSIGIGIFILISSSNTVTAISKPSTVTVIYEVQNNQQLLDVRLIEANLSALFDEVTLIPVEEVADSVITSETLVGYSQQAQSPYAETIRKHLQNYDGQIIALGKFYRHVEQFPIWSTGSPIPVHTLGEMALTNLTTVQPVVVKPDTTIRSTATGFDGEIPLIIEHDKHIAYFAEDFQQLEVQILFCTLFKNHTEQVAQHPAYLIVEDINPLTDVKQLQQVTDLLTEARIPIVLSISPIYEDNKTGATTLSKASLLVEQIQHLQKQGAQIFMSDFSTAGRNTNGMEADASLPLPKERDVQQRVFADFETAAQIMILEEIYPTGVAMRPNDLQQESYHEIGQHVSAFAGDYLASQGRNSAPFYISKPQLLNNQTYFPITLNVAENDPSKQIKELEAQINKLSLINHSVISTSYSMYEDIEQLKARMDMLKKVPSLYWYDFTLDSYPIELEAFSIHYQSGQWNVVSNWSIFDEMKWTFRDRPLEMVLWLLIFLPIVFVSIFAVNIFVMRIRYRKNLFEERR